MYPKISPNNGFDHTFIHKDNKMVPAYDFFCQSFLVIICGFLGVFMLFKIG